MNNSEPNAQTQAQPSSRRIVLTISGLGEVPSFKNTKSIFRNRKTGKPFVATKPERKLWMERAIRLIESQLRGWLATNEGVTPGECPKRSLIASCMPLDDSIAWMIPGEQAVRRVPKGEEGAVIVIERLQ